MTSHATFFEVRLPCTAERGATPKNGVLEPSRRDLSYDASFRSCILLAVEYSSVDRWGVVSYVPFTGIRTNLHTSLCAKNQDYECSRSKILLCAPQRYVPHFSTTTADRLGLHVTASVSLTLSAIRKADLSTLQRLPLSSSPSAAAAAAAGGESASMIMRLLVAGDCLPYGNSTPVQNAGGGLHPCSSSSSSVAPYDSSCWFCIYSSEHFLSLVVLHHGHSRAK